MDKETYLVVGLYSCCEGDSCCQAETLGTHILTALLPSSLNTCLSYRASLPRNSPHCLASLYCPYIVSIPHRASITQMTSTPWLTSSPSVSKASTTLSKRTFGPLAFHSMRSPISDSHFHQKENRHMSHRSNYFRIS